MNKRRYVYAAWPLIAMGCGSSQGKEVRDARMEQVEARADETHGAVEDQKKARDEVITQQANASEHAVVGVNQKDANASGKLVDVSKDRALYQSKAQEKLDQLGVRINAAQQKLQVLGARAPTKLTTELNTVAEEHGMLKRDIAKLRDTPPPDWDRTTKQIDDRLSNLDDRVSKLSDSIDDA
jgi:hypothetical protein